MVSDKALALQLCRNEFPRRQKGMKQGTRLLAGKAYSMSGYMGGLRELYPLGSLNHSCGAFLLGFLWVIISIHLVLSLC